MAIHPLARGQSPPSLSPARWDGEREGPAPCAAWVCLFQVDWGDRVTVRRISLGIADPKASKAAGAVDG